MSFKTFKMRIMISSLIAFFTLFFTPFLSSAEEAKRVSIIQVIEHPALNEARRGIEDELKKAGILFDYESAQGNPGLASQIAHKFVGNKPDAMVGIGTTASQALISANHSYPIPIVFCSVTDPLGAKLVDNLKKPGGFVTGVSDFTDSGIQMDLFKKILPHLKKLGIIYNPGESNSVALLERMKAIAKTKELTLVAVATNSSADVSLATESLMGKVDAIFINNDNTALSAFESIVKIATKHKIPVFCSDTDMINTGALAALGPNQYALGQQTGRIIIQILNGKAPSEIPVAFPDKTELQLNLKMAKELGIVFPQSLLQQAAQVIE